jgi:predicted nuclease with RNAse H fold
MALLVGVDVQGDELIVAFRRDGSFLPPGRVAATAVEVRDHALQLRQDAQERVLVAIDAPRRYLAAPRLWRLNNGGVWVVANLPSGRHCEIIVRRLGLANPLWTPPATQPIPWITLGQQLFTVCEAAGFTTIECFPTASYTCFGQMNNIILNIPGEMFAHSRLAHDILDACVAALTADLFLAGNATELGGDDGYMNIRAGSAAEQEGNATELGADDGYGTIVIPGVLQLPFPAYPTP